MVRAIRGATTVENNDKEEVLIATQELLKKIIEKNNLIIDDIIDIIFTITVDLNKVFPARAARNMGIVDVPLLDMAEPDIEGSLKKCIRILVHTNSDKRNSELKHIYLNGAAVLRPDLVNN